MIRNASLNLGVTDVQERAGVITSMAEEMGGWVVSYEASQLNRNSPDLIRAVVSIRVPAERLDEALARIKNGVVRILNETITGQNVTDQYTDLMSNLKNLQAAEEQLRKILEAATSTEDVLNVYRELTRVRGEIEVIQGRLNYLEQSAAYSSIVVTLQPDLPPTPTPTATATPTAWSLAPVAEQAGASLVGAFQGLLSLLVWAVVFALPLALVIGLPTLIVLRVAQRFWPSQPGKGTVEQPTQVTDKK